MINSTLVTVVVPLYNSQNYITETLESVLHQSYTNLEIVVIDDGSTDDSALKVLELAKKNQSIKYFRQRNSGVSVARNNGLNLSKGDYIIFLDSDDILESKFIENKLSLKSLADFIGSKVISFTDNTSNIQNDYTSPVSDLQQEILFYNPKKVTCPSAYLFSKNFLINNKISFNEKLSSTADREFLLQITHFGGKGELDLKDNGAMLYRVHPNSMSNLFTKKLVDDNAAFYIEINHKNLISKDIKSKANKLGNKILFKSYLKIGIFPSGIKYFMKYLFS